MAVSLEVVSRRAGRRHRVPGQFVVRKIAGESLIILRDDRGKLHTFYNVCRHRGTRLVNKCAGRTGSTLQCPYHAWTYDLSGCSIAAPQMDRVEDFRLEDYPLAQVETDTWDGHIFLNFTANPGNRLRSSSTGSTSCLPPGRWNSFAVGSELSTTWPPTGS